jgi:hypothetical protein
MAGRFIKLYDKILSWEWYKNINVKVLFLHLLLKANYKDLSFEGHTIRRGQLVTSLPSLSAELGMSTKQIRGSLDHLIATGEVASKAYPRYRVITIVHYDDYQAYDSQDGNQTAVERAVKRQAKGSQTAGSGQAEGSQRAASIEYIEQKEDIEKIEPIERSRAASRFIPPPKEAILYFCLDNNLNLNVDRFYDYYSMQGWKLSNGNPMRDWQAAVRQWVSRDQKRAVQASAPAPRQVKQVPAQQYEQRDYGKEDSEAMQRQIEELRKRGIV